MLISSRGKNTRIPLDDLIRYSVNHRLAGYEDVNDAERLCRDPTFRLIGSEKIWERGPALTSRVHSFETELLTQDEDLTWLATIKRKLIARAEALTPSRTELTTGIFPPKSRTTWQPHRKRPCGRWVGMQTGSLVAQRYRLEEQLGEGGMGVVFKAFDTALDRSVAIKALSPHLIGDEGLRRLLREAQSAAKLTHPNIVAIHDVIDHGDTRLIVMEYVAGRTLRQVMPLPYAEAVEIASQVCLALEYAHAHGIVHRDIKPENIIIAESGTAKVMDFGLARSEGRSRMTQTGMIVGTVAYMAPEQALSGTVDGRSDLYSLGAVLYEAITGKQPFEADDPIAVISMHVNVPPVSPRFHRSEIPGVLESIILRLLAKDPTERYASAEELARVFKSVLVAGESPDGTAPTDEARPTPTSLFEMMTQGRLIDREEEVAALKRALESMLSAKGQVVFVAGEPGIGKTRLAEELLVYARLRGALAIVGHCYEQEVNVPYLPFVESLRAAVRGIAGDRLGLLVGPYAAELVKLVPELSRRIPELIPTPPLEPDQERMRLYDNVTAFLAGLARAQPLVLMLDDLHWADAATLQLLRHLARSSRAERLLILGTYRDVEVDPTHPLSSALSEMNRERLYRRVLVRGLAPQFVAAMIQSIIQAPQPVSVEFRDVIYQETEGNPFFVEEVLKHLVEIGALYLEGGRWQRKPIEEIDIPQSVREVIGRRLERVSESCQRVLGLAAVIGRRFRFEVLQALAELAEAELLDALEEATRTQLIREESRLGGVEYDFAHALIREVLYERLSVRRRMSFHQKVGETLERQYAGRLEAVIEDLAHHFTLAPQGEGLGKAIQYSLEAARKAMSVFGYEEAVRYYQNAAELLGEGGDERRLAEVNVALAEPFAYLDNPAAALAAYERALKYFEREGTATDAARVRGLIGRALARHRNYSEAIPHLEYALQHLSPEEHATDVIQIHRNLASAKTFTGKVNEAEQHAAQSLALAKERGTLSMQASAYGVSGLIAVGRMDIDAAKVHYREAIKLARQASDPQAYTTLTTSLNNMAFAHQLRGEHAEVLPLLLEAREVARRVKDIRGISFQNARLAAYYFFGQGDSQTAKQYILENLRMPLSARPLLESERMLRQLDFNLKEAAALTREILEHNRHTGDVQAIVINSTVLASLTLELGETQEARDAAVEAAEILESNEHFFLTPFVGSIAEALARGGEHQRCEAFCARGEALSRAANSPPGLAGALFGRAMLALERHDPGEAVQRLDECLQLAPSVGVPFRARMLHGFAQALSSRRNQDDIQRAKEVLQQSLVLFDQMGDARKVEQLRAELSSLR